MLSNTPTVVKLSLNSRLPQCHVFEIIILTIVKHFEEEPFECYKPEVVISSTN